MRSTYSKLVYIFVTVFIVCSLFSSITISNTLREVQTYSAQEYQILIHSGLTSALSYDETLRSSEH